MVKKIDDAGHHAIAVRYDVSDEESVKASVDTVLSQYKKIDILLNDAGVAQGGSVESLTTQQCDNSMNINVKSIYLMSKYIVPQMKKHKIRQNRQYCLGQRGSRRQSGCVGLPCI